MVNARAMIGLVSAVQDLVNGPLSPWMTGDYRLDASFIFEALQEEFPNWIDILRDPSWLFRPSDGNEGRQGQRAHRRSFEAAARRLAWNQIRAVEHRMSTGP